MRRRSILQKLGASATIPLAGCSVSLPISQKSKLGRVGILNYDQENKHTFEIVVNKNQNEVHRSIHELDRATDQFIPAKIIECTWDYTNATYAISARVDDHQWNTWNLTERDTGSLECVAVDIAYGSRSWIDQDNPLAFGIRGDCSNSDRFVGGCVG
jgi:hypothetical protein